MPIANLTGPLRLFTFKSAFGLPTGGPFGLKLEACFRMLGVPYERVFENDVRKGPNARARGSKTETGAWGSASSSSSTSRVPGAKGSTRISPPSRNVAARRVDLEVLDDKGIAHLQFQH